VIEMAGIGPCPFAAMALELMGLNDPDYKLRDDPTHWSRLRSMLAIAFRQRTRAEWCELLEHSDACCVPVLTMDEAMYHSHISARQIFVDWNGMAIPAPSPRFSRTPGNVSPSLGTDREAASAVLRDWDSA
jgi:alpha-methylacyl-CoA racemase